MVVSSVLCLTDVNESVSIINFDYNNTLRNFQQDPAVMAELPEWLENMEFKFNGLPNMPWVYALFGSLLVGLTGIFPLFIIDIEQLDSKNPGGSLNKLKSILGFAVGALLGDVFLHSLPEIYSNNVSKFGQQNSGLLVLCGLISFIALDKIFSTMEVDEKHIAGYLNLLANTTDNFTHGLSLGGAFLVSNSLGFITTFAILLHEIPHEFGDFAILLKAGFTRKQAGIYQILTAAGGFLGALFAILCSGATNSIEARTSWILPFTAGSFLHIALVTVLPDLLKEDDPKEAFKQIASLLAGILLIALVGNIFE